MTGIHQVIVQNRRVQYKFTLTRNITILQGDSATGKTKMIEMVAAYQQDGGNSGVTVSCDKECVVLSGSYWMTILSSIKDSIVFIDEGEQFVTSTEFAKAVQESDNYYVIATRSSLLNLTYSAKEVYGIRNKSGNRYQGTKRLYSEFYPLNKDHIDHIPHPQVVIVEDSNSGFEFFKAICDQHAVKCISANGNGNIYNLLREIDAGCILVVADGAAFGQQMERVLSLKKVKHIVLYLPESFEWLILESGLISGVYHILRSPADYIESSKYYSWERFFTNLLVEETKNTYLQYTKKKLNQNYLQKNETEKILKVIPQIRWNN